MATTKNVPNNTFLAALTRDDKRKFCIAYLASGNSVEDLCIQILETLGDTDLESGAVESFFWDTVDDVSTINEDNQQYVEEYVQDMIKLYDEDSKDSFNTPCWG
jgi:hypothetical protein